MADRKAAFAKRQRELDKKAHLKQKAEKLAERRARAASGDTSIDPDIDPDLIGIVPGPQPRPDDEIAAEDKPADDGTNGVAAGTAAAGGETRT